MSGGTPESSTARCCTSNYDDRSREATVISVWGDSQWFRNISAKPAAQVEIGLQRYTPTQRFLNAEEIVDLRSASGPGIGSSLGDGRS